VIDLFHQLKTAPPSKDKLKECISNVDWFKKENFDLANLNNIILLDNTKLLKTVTKFRGNACIIKMNPMTWYNWHTDVIRKAAINFLIEGYDSKCFFGKQQDSNNFNLTELPYQMDCMYLFNVQRNHAVLNLSETRYLLSIGFNYHSYEEILEYCLEQDV
jgi:hypothetical protein